MSPQMHCILNKLKALTLNGILALVIGVLFASLANAQIFVVNEYDSSGHANSGSIGEYSISGALINASLISGLHRPDSIAVAGSNLFVANSGNGTIGEYTTSGATVNASLITGLCTGLCSLNAVAVSGSNLFVANGSSIGEYTTSGATVNSSLFSTSGEFVAIALSGSNLFTLDSDGVVGEYTTSGGTVNSRLIVASSGTPEGMAIAGTNIFLPSYSNGKVSEYTTSGTLINTALVTQPALSVGIAVDGSDLFLAGLNGSAGIVSEYTTSGATINTNLIPSLSYTVALAIAPVPEPETYALLLAGLGLLGFVAHRRKRNVA